MYRLPVYFGLVHAALVHVLSVSLDLFALVSQCARALPPGVEYLMLKIWLKMSCSASVR